MDIKLKILKKGDNKEFRLVQNLTMGEAGFNQFMRLRQQPLTAAGNSARPENLSVVLIPTMSKDMDEQLKLAHKVVDVMDGAKKKVCLTLLQYNVDKPESFYAQVRIVARKMENEKFQQSFYVKFKLKRTIYLIEVMRSVIDKVITNQPICNVQKK